MAWTIGGRKLYIARFKRAGDRKVHLWQQWHKDVSTARVAFRRTLNAEFGEGWVMMSVKAATAAEEKQIRGGHPLRNPVDLLSAAMIGASAGATSVFVRKKLEETAAGRNPTFPGKPGQRFPAGRKKVVPKLKGRRSNSPTGFSIAMVPRKGPRLVLPRVFASKAEAQQRARKIRRPFGTRTAIVPAARNPYKAAVATSEGFHGRPVEETIEIVTHEHEHEYLAALGELISLEVLAPDSEQEVLPLKGFKGAWLAENEHRNQLFVKGGDQSLTDEQLRKFDIDLSTLHETEVLGPLAAITYHTVKYHLGDQGGNANFRHVFGEEGGKLPVLVYRVRDGLVEIAGGSYTIPDEGVTN